MIPKALRRVSYVRIPELICISVLLSVSVTYPQLTHYLPSCRHHFLLRELHWLLLHFPPIFFIKSFYLFSVIKRLKAVEETQTSLRAEVVSLQRDVKKTNEMVFRLCKKIMPDRLEANPAKTEAELRDLEANEDLLEKMVSMF